MSSQTTLPAMGYTNSIGEDKFVMNGKQLPNLKNFDIVLINYVEKSKKGKLLNELGELYGEYQPLEIGVQSFRSSPNDSPDSKFVKKILYYDEFDKLKKPVPEEFQSLEIRILNHIDSWCEVICKVRLKPEWLQKGIEEFSDRLEKEHTLRMPDTLEKARRELETYLSPYIMDNITAKRELERRQSYPFIYMGEVGRLSSQNTMDIIKITDYTRDFIGWLALRWASILTKTYLIERIDPGFSILNLVHVEEAKEPESWDKNTKRRFRASSFEYSIIDNVSCILLPYAVFNYRLESIKNWERDNVSLSHKVQELLDIKNSRDYLNQITTLQKEIERQRSEFLAQSLDMQNECYELSSIIKSALAFLSSRDYKNSPIEEPFFHPIDAESIYIEEHINSGNPKQGALASLVMDSQSVNEQLTNRMSKIEEGQTRLSAYVHDIVNAGLNKSIERLTKGIFYFTLVLLVLGVIQIAPLVYKIVRALKP